MKIKNILYTLVAGVLAVGTASCSDDIDKELRSEAEILPFGFTVTNTEGKTFQTKFSDDGSTIYIYINELSDPKEVLKNAVPTFCLSMGATVTPPMNEPQDFSDLDNPVIYTVTSGDGKNTRTFKVTYIPVAVKIEYGKPFTGCEKLAVKTYVEMGFPGTYPSWVTYQNTIDVNKGDLLAFPAFCGKDKFVMFSRRYAWGDDGKTYGGQVSDVNNIMDADHRHAFKVYDTKTLTENGTLNLGGISPTDVVAITSDWVGNMVAAVGRLKSGKTDFYAWKSPEDTPRLVGSAEVSCEMGNHSADGGSYINVAGDINGTAAIAAAAPRTDTGDHYRFQVYGGKLVPDYKVIHTGHSANDKAWFQMISFFGPDENDPYLVGDTSDLPGKDSGQINAYLNNPDGTNRSSMDYYNTFINGALHDDGEAWWSRSGLWAARGGCRRPTVHAMVINGIPYSYFTTGTDWRNRAILMNQEFTTGIPGYPNWGYGLDTKAKNPNPEEGGQYLPYSFGMMCDWFFDDVEQDGYVAVWSERFGVVMFHITCYDE